MLNGISTPPCFSFLNFQAQRDAGKEIWAEQNNKISYKDVVKIQAISSRELLCQNIILTLLILLLVADFRVVKNNYPRLESQNGENGKHLSVC